MKYLFNLADLNREDIFKIIDKKSSKDISGKSIGTIFEKYSTRTRLSFNVAIYQMGANAVDIKYEELNISRLESFEDTFKTFSCYLDAIIYRTSNHKKLIIGYENFKKPIINALSDISHPCQIISDLYTLKKNFNTLELEILWVGDMNNVCFSLVEAVNIVEEMKLNILTPDEISKNVRWKFGKNISIVNRKEDINFEKINCVMTDVYISMNDEESDEKIESLKPYQVNDDLMNLTNSNCIFMHCLPANIGSEVSKSVIDGPKSIVWQQAKNRMIVQKEILKCLSW